MFSIKKLIVIAIYIFSYFSSKSQVTFYPKDAGEEKMATFKSTITLFSLQYKDYTELEKFNQAIASVWTITPFLIIKPDELSKYIDKPGYTYFAFSGFKETNGKTTVIRFFYALDLPTFKKNGKKGSNVNFGNVLIYPDDKTLYQTVGNTFKFGGSKTKDVDMITFLYTDAILYNWSPGVLRAYLKQINDGLLTKKNRKNTFEMENKMKLASLLKDTLYVPEYVKLRFSMFTMSEKVDEEKDESLAEAYKLPIKFVSTKELNELILKKGSNINYLVYTKSTTDKVVTIYNSASNELLYQAYSAISYNFNAKDLRKIRNLIK
ncbi:hypothetical protein EZJ43_13950 [Pedobacter changchengzhani]|uniref:Uncharacterized protein n=1 Tax=Pedobacter changchengzhani TaxID=2529274 RepID=A0A4R5MIH0_9SPHI|nr:hypothetical protein [Pedobacter changchengzhani]TDG35397.1 hypothetical protein EZJ43_13950 [Pedobacter changchengzhani]